MFEGSLGEPFDGIEAAKAADFRKTYGDISAVPTPAYYDGLRDKEEIVRLLNMTEPPPAPSARSS